MEQFKIDIESTGGYDRKKEFNLIVEMSPRDFIALQKTLLDFFEDMENTADIVPPTPKD